MIIVRYFASLVPFFPIIEIKFIRYCKHFAFKDILYYSNKLPTVQLSFARRSIPTVYVLCCLDMFVVEENKF